MTTTVTGRRDLAGYEAARACFDAGDDDQVIALIREALCSLEKPEDRFKAYLLMACSEWRKGWAKQSLQTLGKAEVYFESMSPRLKGRFHGQRAVGHSRLKNHDAAVMDLVAAKFWAEEANDQEEIAIARNNLAKQYSDCDRLGEAIEEVDAAILLAERLKDDSLLGQCLDLKAQILVNHNQFEEALRLSNRAMKLLEEHPAITEARETHGRALISLGTSYLTQDDPVATFRARRNAADLIPVTLTSELIRLALEQSNGNVLNAAARLGIYHSALLKAMKNYGVPHKPRARSLVTK